MNSETSFRIASIVLTVACILCGITAASYLAAHFFPYRNAVVQKKIAANAPQVNLSEFPPNPGQSTSQSHHSSVASRAPLLSASKTTANVSESSILLNAPTQTDQNDRKDSVIAARPDQVPHTTVKCGESPRESEGHSVSHFYAPITVHPLTVNIDNAGIIREISRIHERLDSLSAEATLAQSGATHHETFATAPFMDSDAQPYESSSQKNVHDAQMNHTSPSKNFDPECPSIIVTDSSTAVAVTAPLVSGPEPTPEIQFEMTADQQCADTPIAEDPAVDAPAEETAKVPEFEFSTGVFAIPVSKDVLANTLQNDVQFVAIADSAAVEPIAPIAAPVPVQWPVLPGVATFAVPISQSAKRTTDPAFMNGRSQRVPAPPTQVAKEAIGARDRVAHTTQATGKHMTHSDCQKCMVPEQATNPTYPIQRGTPSQAFLRIKSALLR